MSNIYNVQAVVNISFSGKRLLAGVENEIDVKTDTDRAAAAQLFEQGKLINVGDDMVILKSKTTTSDGELLPGTRIDGLLEDDVVDQLIESGAAIEVKARPKNSADNKAIDPSTLNDGDVLNFDEESLSKLTVVELKELAKDLEIEGYANMKKAELIAVLIDSAEEGESE